MSEKQKSTDWTPSYNLPGYESRLNEDGHVETRPITAEHMGRCICGLCHPEHQSRTCRDHDKIVAAEARNRELIDERDEIKHAADLRVISLQSERDQLQEQLAQQFNAAKQFSEAVVRLTEQRDNLVAVPHEAKLYVQGESEKDRAMRERIHDVLLAAIKATALPAAQKTVDRVQKFWDAQAEWSQATFGSDEVRGPIGPLKHLEKEAQECQQDPYDIEEKADCLFLIFDATRRSRKSLSDLLDAAEAKLAKNKLRSWPKNAPGDTAIEHVRSAALPATQVEGEK